MEVLFYLIFVVIAFFTGFLFYQKSKIDVSGYHTLDQLAFKSNELFKVIQANIHSCKTYGELVNCYEWTTRSEFDLSPKQYTYLLEEVRRKEKELEKNLSAIMGDEIGKFQ